MWDKIFLGDFIELQRGFDLPEQARGEGEFPVVKDFKDNHPRFVYYFLKTLKLEQYNSGVGVPTLNRNDLDKVEIKIPPLPVQRRIAEMLGRYDALIENYQRQIGLLEAMAREIYREWFVRGRCPYAQTGGLRMVSLNEISQVNIRSITEQDENTVINYVDISSVHQSATLCFRPALP